ncbi:hypothetical protein V6N11_074566 [Hibiscus sabdariffa]|uniref:TF-B3 domain-containing protein n=1 Tax=Hibiscus sabdariffa TaxID=183260 RepID=A0ABR2R3X2_9ROSI
MEGDCSFDDEEEENDCVPTSQLFQLLHQGIHDCPERVVRKRPREDKNHNYGNVSTKAVIMETEEACANSPVVKRAEEVQANLPLEFPSFFKIMTPSTVCRGFWMSLPREFCQLNLPNHDGTVILVGKTGKEYRTNFLIRRRALSGGWKKFSDEHGLLVGDAVVFQLIKPSKFKVYIVRVNGLAEVDAALGLLRLQNSAKQTGICNRTITSTSLDEKAGFEQSRDAIRASDSEISTPRADGGLHHLRSLTFEPKQEAESRRYKEAECLELELLGKKEEMQRLDTEIEGLTVNSKRCEQMFEAAANAPW